MCDGIITYIGGAKKLINLWDKNKMITLKSNLTKIKFYKFRRIKDKNHHNKGLILSEGKPKIL